ncbi:MAG: PAS domain S-box protein [Acidobacteria bacterium]|nr:PAS domain S-box protein [Acidobacteriota bacterium]
MADHIIAIFDVISFFAFLSAFLVLFRVPRKRMGRSTRAFLQAALFIYVFVGFSNTLQYSGITAALDPYEDFAQIVFPLLFLFFVYSTMLRSEVGLRLISEKQFVQSIDRAEKRFRLFTEQSPAVVFIVDVDGRHIYANRRCRELNGISVGNGNIPKWPDEVMDTLRRHNQLALEEGKWEGREQIPDGHGRIHTYQVTKFRIQEEDGTVFIGGIALDVTEYQALLEEQRQLASIIEQLGEGVMVTDSDGEIIFVNRAYEQMTGYPLEELIGKNPRILKSGKQDMEFYRKLWGTITSGKTWQGKLINKRKDGKLYHEQATVFPVSGKGGNIQYFAAVKRDITHEIKMEENLRQSQKMETIGQLVGGIAHDFNNILTAINGYSELAISNLEPGSKARSHMERVRDAGERAAALTKKLLGFGRKQMIQPKVLDISEIVRRFQPIVRRLIGEDIELVLKLGEDLPPIFADPAQIEQILMNLLVNARDAINENRESGERRIVIEASELYLDEAYVKHHVGASVGPHILLNVTDTGKGIPEDLQLRIFEPFFTTKKVGTGTGLGLATILGIIKQNNGSIFVYSEEGGGTTFKVYWPIYKAEDSVGELRRKVLMDNHVVNGEGVILVVEDEEDVRAIAVAVLKSAGYTLLEAESAESALEMMKSYEGPLDLLFTDIVMPGMNGMELAEKLSELRPGIKKLYASGYSEEVLEQKGLHGVNGSLLLKPYSRGELTRRISDLLNKSRSV